MASGSRSATMLAGTGVALALAAACAGPPSQRGQVLRSFRQTVADDLGGVVTSPALDCGEVASSYDELVQHDSEPRRCLARAFRACQPARVDGSYDGVDSGPFYWSAVVTTRADKGGCEVRYYEDVRLDTYGDRSITRYRCGDPAPETGASATRGSCELVWKERHVLCREYAGEATAPGARQMTCVELPADVRWSGQSPRP
ncbi:hypothetical protein [Polyangium jinanense]|uniref:Lipoprotein n=1 Tax=Polyangium jinanense TaxID=2829994 RepID=A0A9X3XDU7_9BACT|nr:hypothetical protein [Polyangium jinanense]MDC3959825.1 hypothetical protein [Polyangium jinanense]MDC3986276.1 hypothetical protein [Polyangium jinanense]